MKLFKALMAALLVAACAAPASAQVYESKSYIKKTSKTTTIDNSYKNYSRIGLYYNNMSWWSDYGDESLNGLDIQYVYGINLTKRYPMYLEVGGAFKFGVGGDDGEDWQDFMIEVPVNYTYRFFFNNRKIAISPFVGLNFNIHLSTTANFNGNDWDAFEDLDGRRFQMGWKIGSNFDFRKFYIGLSYGTDFWGVLEDSGSGTFNLGLGFVF